MLNARKISLVLALAIASLPLLAQAETSTDYYRTDKVDVYMKFENMQSKQLNYDGPTGPLSLKLDYTNLWGIGFAKHLDQGLEARFETLWGNTTISGLGSLSGLSSETFINTGTFNLDYNILKKRLTPFISGGFGWQYMEAQGRNGVYVPGYWDPWYGYVGGYYTYPVYYESDFMWNTGAGIRYDFTSDIFLKVYAEVSFVYYRNINGPINMPKYGIAFGGSY